MSNRYKVAALTAALALTVSAAPTLAQDDMMAAPEVPAAELDYQGEITMWNTMRDFELAEVQTLIDAWEAAHPGITVKHDPVSFDTAEDNFRRAAEAGNAPDILRADIGWTIAFADDGFLLDLAPLVDLSDFLPAPLETASWKGGTYGVPHVTDALGMQCNKALLAEAGLEAAPTSWDELVEAGSTIADLEAQQYGYYQNSQGYYAQTFTWGWGGQLYNVNEDGSVDVLINSPESIEGWNYLKDNILGVIAPATWDFPNSYGNIAAAFKDGTLMCTMNGPWSVGDHLSGAAFEDASNLVIAPVPEGTPGNTGTPVGGHNYVVYALVANDEAKQAAVIDLLEYINGAEAQAFLATGPLGLLPTRSSAYELESVQDAPLIAAWGPVMEKATNRVGHPKSSAMYVPYDREFEAFLSGSKTAEQALADLEAAWVDLFSS